MPRVTKRALICTVFLATFPAVACAQATARLNGTAVVSDALPPAAGIRDVPGVYAGHYTLSGRPTGCTVVLTPGGAVGGVEVGGGAPGTRETDVLDPINTVQVVHGIVLSGGSAFGLATADGVARFLAERDIGFAVGDVHVPIVPAAILFDLSVGDPTIRPGADCGYRAAEAALAGEGPLAEGNVGAGAGATVGKIAGMARAMKAGIGTASVRLPSGLVVAAVVATNAVGDVVDPATGRIVAGVRTEQGDELASTMQILRGGGPSRESTGQNTVIGIVATNAHLTKAQATRVARMAQDGLARAVVPSHTPWDGDTMFALATGDRAPGDDDLLTIGALAADVVAEAILRGVRAATSIEGIPAVADLPRHDAP